jgi:hypothetical protein
VRKARFEVPKTSNFGPSSVSLVSSGDPHHGHHHMDSLRASDVDYVAR